MRYSGTLTSPDGKQVLHVDKGHIVDSHNKEIAQMLADGTLKFPASNQSKHEDINAAFHNFKFEGSDNGLARSFTASTHMPDGKLFLTDGNIKQAECLVQMGMLIDAHSGKQIGSFVEAPSYRGNTLVPGKIAFADNPSHAVSLDDARFKNTVFDINIKGQVFDDHRRLQGVCTGVKARPAIDLQD